MRNQSPVRRRGFSLPEVLIAVAITATLLFATLMALNVSFIAFRSTTRTVSTSMSGRIVIERLQALIRAGIDFGPLPANPLETIVSSDSIDIEMGDGDWVTLRWDSATSALLWEEDGDSWPLLEGVTQIPDGEVSPISPFTLEYTDGRWLNRAVIDLVVEHDDAQDISIEGDRSDQFRLVGSAMPRLVAWQ